jgi:hypothetical protein
MDSLESQRPSDLTNALIQLGEEAAWHVRLSVDERRADRVSELVDAHAAAALACARHSRACLSASGANRGGSHLGTLEH